MPNASARLPCASLLNSSQLSSLLGGVAGEKRLFCWIFLMACVVHSLAFWRRSWLNSSQIWKLVSESVFGIWMYPIWGISEHW